MRFNSVNNVRKSNKEERGDGGGRRLATQVESFCSKQQKTNAGDTLSKLANNEVESERSAGGLQPGGTHPRGSYIKI